MHRGTRNPRKLKERYYAACMVEINEYLAALPGEKASEKLARQNCMKYFEHYSKWIDQKSVRTGGFL